MASACTSNVAPNGILQGVHPFAELLLVLSRCCCNCCCSRTKPCLSQYEPLQLRQVLSTSRLQQPVHPTLHHPGGLSSSADRLARCGSFFRCAAAPAAPLRACSRFNCQLPLTQANMVTAVAMRFTQIIITKNVVFLTRAKPSHETLLLYKFLLVGGIACQHLSHGSSEKKDSLVSRKCTAG
jgi:hypothetical protein